MRALNVRFGPMPSNIHTSLFRFYLICLFVLYFCTAKCMLTLFLTYNIDILHLSLRSDVIHVVVSICDYSIPVASANVDRLGVMVRSSSALNVAAGKGSSPDRRSDNIFASHIILGGISAIIRKRLSDGGRFDCSCCNCEREADQGCAEALACIDAWFHSFGDVDLVVSI